MSGRDPIDFDSPLGISKREWTKVLGANLALLLLAYCVALVFTLCGSDVFLLNFSSDKLNEMEQFLGNRDLLWCVQVPVACIEETIICAYVAKRKPSLLVISAFLLLAYTECVVIYFTTRFVPGYLDLINGVSILVLYIAFLAIKEKKPRKLLIYGARGLIAAAITLGLNEIISLFRIKVYELFQVQIPSSANFALNIEYIIALALVLGFLTLLIKWEKGERQKWNTQPAGGSSPTSKRWSLKNSPTKNNLSHKQRRKIALLKARVIVIQTVALAVIAALPWFTGKPIEFTLLYVAFCLTRVILGFSHSLHFKSELACVTIGALTFWGLTFLAPSAEASIIMSLVYGAGIALGFRLYWELHDLLMYRKAAKTDRYAMFYTAFKGNIDPRHIRGVMRLRGFIDEDLIKAVQMYMAKEKVDYIAEWLNEPLRSVDRKLTEIADELYRLR